MRWTIKPKPEPEKVNSLIEALQVDPIVASLLVQRGIETYEAAKLFFRPDMSHLHDPYLMKDMDKAVKRIEQAISNNERILIYGDYDVDGTTSVALMSLYLETRYDKIATYIPDRYDEGYGISIKGIDFAYDNDFKLIIALDCGIKAIDKIEYAKNKGIDFIICDHHRPGLELPDAVAVLDPKREDCNYPFKELCGCGVGFKLIQALAGKNNETFDDLTAYLDLVATAIAADIVPIIGENRVLAYFGLQVINKAPRTGIKAILKQIKKDRFNITDVVFIIAPRINAAGRMKHGNHAVALLKETDINLAAQYALEIDQFNTDRKETDKQITKAALQQIIDLGEEDRYTTVVYDPDWHKGVVGIVASRLIETYYRPTLVFTKSGDKLVASARSVKGFDVYEAIEACSDLIVQFGGHKYAAGLTILEDNYQSFKHKFETVVSNSIADHMRVREITIDTDIKVRQITARLFRIITQFAPFGPGNMMPVFMTEALKDTGYAKCVGDEKQHLKFSITQNGSNKIDAIGFNLGNKYEAIQNRRPFKAIYTIDENHWNGKISLQLKIKDIKN